MSIVSVAEIGRGKRRGRLTDKYEREYSRFFRVRTSSGSIDPYTVATASGLPAVYDAYPTDAGSLCKELVIQEQQPDDERAWIVEARYSSATVDQSLQAFDPLNEPADIDLDTMEVEHVIQQDIDGEPLVNSAGDPWRDGYTTQKQLLVVRYQDNVADMPAGDITKYAGHANDQVFWNKHIATVLLGRFSAKRNYRNGVLFWRRNLEFRIIDDEDTDYNGTGLWTSVALLDVGYRYLVSGNPVPAGRGGETPANPLFLDGSGGLLNGDGSLDTGQTPSYRYFRVKGTEDFNDLNLQTVLL